MKKREILQLSEAIEIALNFNLAGVRFTQGLLHNKTTIKDTVKIDADMRAKLREPLKEYDEVIEKGRVGLIEKLGHPQPDGGAGIDKDDKETMAIFAKERAVFNKKQDEKHKTELAKYKSDMEEYEPILDEEVEFTPYTIKLEDFPNPFNPRLQEVFYNAGITVDPIKVD